MLSLQSCHGTFGPRTQLANTLGPCVTPSYAGFLLPSHTTLHKSKTTLHILEELFSPCHLQQPTLQKSETKSPADRGAAPPWLHTFTLGSHACHAVDGGGHPGSPTRRGAPVGSSPPLLPSPLLSLACLLRQRSAVQPAASPAPAPNALTTAVGLIIKITF